MMYQSREEIVVDKENNNVSEPIHLYQINNKQEGVNVKNNSTKQCSVDQWEEKKVSNPEGK